jgi:DNA-binding response OmpR family regulator
MARILLGNGSETVGKELAQLLTNRGHRVTTCFAGNSLDDVMRRLGHEFEIVILDVSSNDFQARNDLAVIKHHKMHGGPKPMLLCVSRVYHGPRFELELEQKGARVVYVR